jgi:glycosyltransferase involved in cell wall biosynthesis
MHILQVITDTDRRGAQVFATDLGVAMRARGHHVETVALAPGRQGSPLEVATLGARPRGAGTLMALRARMNAADVTIAHGSSTLLACFIAGFPHHPFVYRQISDSRYWANTWARRLRTAVFLRSARHVVALSAEAKQTLVDHVWAPEHRISVVPNAVPMGEFEAPSPERRAKVRSELAIPDEAFVVLYLGALVQEKGVDLAIEAAATLDRALLLVAGDGPDRGRLERLVGAHDPTRLRLVGPTQHPRKMYIAADVMVLPSRGGDSMPATLIEAAFCALPTVATPIGSIEEIVRHRCTGLIVPVGDREALRDALVLLRDDMEFRARLGEAARRHCIERFEIEPVARAWLSVLAKVLRR